MLDDTSSCWFLGVRNVLSAVPNSPAEFKLLVDEALQKNNIERLSNITGDDVI